MATNKPNNEEEINNGTGTTINPTQNYDDATKNGFSFKDFSVNGLGSQKDSLGQAYIDMNYTNWTQGDDYASLTKRYSEKGRRAMDDTIGQVAARTGGLASSYATTAAQQAYGSWMEKLEDAARALYDSQKSEALNAYNIAAGDYDRQRGIYESDRDFEYGQYRNGVSDARWKDEQITSQYNTDREWDYELAEKEEQDLYDQLYANNGGMTYAEYMEAHPDSTMTEGTFNQILSTATGMYADDHAEFDYQAKDKELESIFTSDGFLWGDWDGDGIVEGENEGTTFDQKFGGSSYGEAYWKTVYDNAARDRSEKNQSDNSDDIEARIYNGESLDDIEKFYGIDGTNKTWESETGKSKAEWQSIYNGNQIKSYTYANTEEGAENIVSSLVRSASMTLSEKDAGNFDHIFGDGAYDAVQTFIKNMSPDDPHMGFEVTQDMNPGLFNDHYNDLVDSLVAAVPGLSYDQILDIVKKANPNAYKAATDDTWLKYSSYEEWKNTPAG